MHSRRAEGRPEPLWGEQPQPADFGPPRGGHAVENAPTTGLPEKCMKTRGHLIPTAVKSSVLPRRGGRRPPWGSKLGDGRELWAANPPATEQPQKLMKTRHDFRPFVGKTAVYGSRAALEGGTRPGPAGVVIRQGQRGNQVPPPTLPAPGFWLEVRGGKCSYDGITPEVYENTRP